MADWDAIVLGLGGVGSAAAAHLAEAGLKVLGIDRFEPVHDRGSSHGKTRIIRQAYFEDPAYVPLLRRAYQLWDELGERSRQPLFERTGLVEMGPADGAVISGVRQSADLHGLDVDEMSLNEVEERWPGLKPAALARVTDDWDAVFERDAGFLHVESCVAAHLRLAAEGGAVLRHQQQVIRWEADSNHVSVITTEGTERAERMVVAAGPWLGEVAATLRTHVTVLRKYQYWLQANEAMYGLGQGFPCFFFDTVEGYFYGFPAIDQRGVKVSRHSGGVPVNLPGGGQDFDQEDWDAVRTFVTERLPGVTTRQLERATCYYTSTPDEHFLIDKLPGQERIVLIGGLSGHGFKFTSVLGQIAAQLTLDRPCPFDIGLFGINRFA